MASLAMNNYGLSFLKEVQSDELDSVANNLTKLHRTILNLVCVPVLASLKKSYSAAIAWVVGFKGAQQT